MYSRQGGRSCATARPPVSASGEPQHTHFCREMSFVAIYALLDVLFSAIHGDEWLFHDYDASAGLPTLAQVCHAIAGFKMLAQGF